MKSYEIFRKLQTCADINCKVLTSNESCYNSRCSVGFSVSNFVRASIFDRINFARIFI